MEVDIITSQNQEIDFAPSNVIKEVVQNVKTICSTPKYSVPMDRLFGINAAPVDRPTPKAMAEIQAEIFAVIRKYEPRCKVKRVSFEGNIDGKLSVKVRIQINEE